jgi:hypothetical protein
MRSPAARVPPGTQAAGLPTLGDGLGEGHFLAAMTVDHMQVPKRQAMPFGHPVPASAAAPGTHCTQRFTAQKGVIPEQSEACAHCTHLDVVVSQTGAAMVVHCVLLVHPARHMKVRWSQMGVVVPQSVSARHATHACVATWQSGLAAAQSVFASHSTHSCVEDSQILAVAGQSVAVMHPTQAPVIVSQS